MQQQPPPEPPEDDYLEEPPFELQGEQRAADQHMAGAPASSWKSQPLVKLIILLVAGGAVTAALLGIFGGKPDEQRSSTAAPPNLREAPGGATTPAYIQAQRQAAEDRARQAAAQGASAMPTPVGGDTRSTAAGHGNVDTSENEGLSEFRIDRRPQRPEPPAAREPVEDNLVALMRQQMQSMMQNWVPVAGKVAVLKTEEQVAAARQAQAAAGQGQGIRPDDTGGKIIVSAGTVNYAQMLTEANSDVPGAILAQVVSGPFNGARLIGAFTVSDDYLVLRFTQLNYKGKDYSISAIALDPDTTLGAMVTEYDGRYVVRVVLPAAASFLEGFASAISDAGSATVVSGDVVIQEKFKRDTEESLYEGGAAAARTVGGFLQQEAARTKALVKVAAGTPFGLFFTQSVREDGQPISMVNQTRPLDLPAGSSMDGAPNWQDIVREAQRQQSMAQQGPSGYGAGGYGGYGSGYGGGYGSNMPSSGYANRTDYRSGGSDTGVYAPTNRMNAGGYERVSPSTMR
ncbi:MAG: DotG/IcmE/VirB10 family protein [Alphaproteobacteria bacterium]|nr:MAG: DotG/IcmE/VirB10 family protein [Alphaproteobacteria bacterium]